ncbi:MAG: hypothetical protein WC568_12430, partial [Candidatus Methanoperedens sp.]
RNKQFGREHIDILAKERHSNATMVVEVKKQGEVLTKKLNCEVKAVFLNSDWANNENISVKGISRNSYVES